MATVGASHQSSNVPLRQVLEGPTQALQDGGGFPPSPCAGTLAKEEPRQQNPFGERPHSKKASKLLELTYTGTSRQHGLSTPEAEAEAAGFGKPLAVEKLGEAKKKVTCCFQVTRWHLLIFFCTHALFVGPHYLNWAPLRQCLLYWNAYGWLCEPEVYPQAEVDLEASKAAAVFLGAMDEGAASPSSPHTSSASAPIILSSPSSSSESEVGAFGGNVPVGGESSERAMPHLTTCKAQEVAIARLFAITTASDFGVSFIGGLLLDAWGPKAASTLGTVSMLLGCILIGVSSMSVCLYIAGFVFYGLGVDAAFYGVISLPMLFPGHEGLTMTVLMSFRCLAWGTPVILERLASPDTLGLSAASVMLGVQATTLLLAVFISLLFIPKAPFQRPQKALTGGHQGGPRWPSLHHQSCESPDRLSTSDMLQQPKAVAECSLEAIEETTVAAAGAAAAAAAAAGVAVAPQAFISSPEPEDGVPEDPAQQQQQQEMEDEKKKQPFPRSLNTTPSFSSVGSFACLSGDSSNKCAAVAPDPMSLASFSPSLHQQKQQQQHEQQGEREGCPEVVVCCKDTASPLIVSSSGAAGSRLFRSSSSPSPKTFESGRRWRAPWRLFREGFGLHAFGMEAREFVTEYVFSAAFMPMVPYFALTLLRGVFFGESSEYLVPQAMKGLHILLGLVFIYPPILGFIADRVGEGVCLVLVNTLGTLLVGLSLVQRHIQHTGVAYLICFCYAAYAPLMSGQIYLYILKAFPQEHLGKLLGLAMTVGGFFSLIATPLFEVSVHRSSNFDIVLGALLALSFLAYGLIYWALRSSKKSPSGPPPNPSISPH